MSLIVWFWIYVAIVFAIDAVWERRDRRRR
jgi:hypothetical protein